MRDHDPVETRNTAQFAPGIGQNMWERGVLAHPSERVKRPAEITAGLRRGRRHRPRVTGGSQAVRKLREIKRLKSMSDGDEVAPSTRRNALADLLTGPSLVTWLTLSIAGGDAPHQGIAVQGRLSAGSEVDARLAS